MKQQLINLKGEIGKTTTLIRDFNAHFSVINRTGRQKISKNMENLNQFVIQRARHPISERIGILFRYTWNIHQEKKHILDQKTNFIKFKRLKLYTMTIMKKKIF